MFYERVCKMLREAAAASAAAAAACGTLNASALGDAELIGWCRAAAAASPHSQQ